MTLPQGYFPVDIEYRTNNDNPSLSIRWQRPGGKVEPIPREALYQKPAPQGVLATYYTADVRLENLADAAPTHQRREPLLHAGPLTTDVGAVIWQTKVAAPFDGSYVFIAEANGRLISR
ncbi:MAG: hypothetical protein R2856_03360 [Caldilineaceae bacterium]